MKKLSQNVFFSMSILYGAMLFVPIPPANAQFFGGLPDCGNTKVLSKIVHRFNKADHSLWLTGVDIEQISGSHERAYNIYADSQIDRRYCRAQAHMSDGKFRRVNFVIERWMGLAGFSWGVEYCLKGSDNWHAYDGWCRVLRR